MNRIDAKFRGLKGKKEKALIVYITCGYPDIHTTEQVVLELEKRGVDIVELGIPFSDPLADGPIIQDASSCALKKRIGLKDIFSLVKRLRQKSQIPICLMGYYNPIFSFGQVKFVNKAIETGVDGLIIPDLPPEEDIWLVSLAKKAGLKTVFFLSPTSSPTRIKYISKVSTGFIYYVSLTGVTGARQALPSDLKQNIKIIKRYTEKPVCVGFGISMPQHVKEICRVSDGAIVGSAVIKVIKDSIGKKDLVEKVGEFVARLYSHKE